MDVYRNPVSIAAASLLSDPAVNRVSDRAASEAGLSGAERVQLAVRPEHLALATDAAGAVPTVRFVGEVTLAGKQRFGQLRAPERCGRDVGGAPARPRARSARGVACANRRGGGRAEAAVSLTLEGVSHAYPGGPPVLTNVDLHIGAGEAHALLGSSGAGKSTLLGVLSGLVAPSAGRVSFGDRDVTNVPTRERNIAQVFQFPVLYPAMTVAENLAFPLRNQGWRKARSCEARVQRGEPSCSDIDDPLLTGPPRAAERCLTGSSVAAIGRALVRPDVSDGAA